MPVFLIYEIVGVFVKTLTVDEKDFPCSSEYFPQPIQINYLRNKKRFLDFLLHFWNLH